jgi:threonine/homoserine/homoserine lactone efflux protein
LEFIPALASLALVHILAVISPGQSFLVVSKLALSSGRPAAFAASFGMGAGSVVWAGAALAGLALVLQHDLWLYALLKLGGGGYLVYIALAHWRHSKAELARSDVAAKPVSLPAAFLQGLMTQLANPKVVIFFGSIFFGLLPAHAPPWVYGASIVIVFSSECLWYSTVATAFSIDRSVKIYLRAKVWIDRTVAVVLGLIGLKLIYDASFIAGQYL